MSDSVTYYMPSATTGSLDLLATPGESLRLPSPRRSRWGVVHRSAGPLRSAAARVRFHGIMKRDRRDIPVRLVPLRSPEAADSLVEGTIDERLALVAILSRRAWATTGPPPPRHPRPP